MGLLGRWRIFTQKEEGSSLIGLGSSIGWRASANYRRNSVGSERSSMWEAMISDEPLHAVVSSVASRPVRRSWTMKVAFGPVRVKKRDELRLMRRPEFPGAVPARINCYIKMS
jgi:hypothetical protein